jgi:DNA-binding MarR family transcriptional regulator
MATSFEIDEGELESVALFRFAIRRLEQRTAAAARRCGLTPQRYLLLLAVCVPGVGTSSRATVSTVSRDLRMPQTTVTDLVARAVDTGLLRREPAPTDARVQHLLLTDEGERRLALTMAALRDDRAELRRALADAFRLFPDEP